MPCGEILSSLLEGTLVSLPWTPPGPPPVSPGPFREGPLPFVPLFLPFLNFNAPLPPYIPRGTLVFVGDTGRRAGRVEQEVGGGGRGRGSCSL